MEDVESAAIVGANRKNNCGEGPN